MSSGDGSDRTAAMHLPEGDPDSGESVPLILANVAGATDVGLRRTNNEDSLLFADLSPEAGVDLAPRETVVGPKGVLMAVSDGMGGHEAGEVASALAVGNLHASLKESWSAHPARDAFEELRNDLRNSVARANRSVLDDAHENPSREGMGATLTAGVIFGENLLVVHVGDSRCYLLRGGVIKCLTQDQSLAEELVKRGIVQRDSRAYDARKSVLTRVIGQKSKLEPDAELVHLARGDRLMFCSDGLYGPVDDETIRDVMQTGDDPHSTVQELIAEAKRGGAPDNVTCIVAWLDGDGLPTKEELDVGGATMSIAIDMAELQGAGDATMQFSAADADRTGQFTSSDVKEDATLQAGLAGVISQLDPKVDTEATTDEVHVEPEEIKAAVEGAMTKDNAVDPAADLAKDDEPPVEEPPVAESPVAESPVGESEDAPVARAPEATVEPEPAAVSPPVASEPAELDYELPETFPAESSPLDLLLDPAVIVMLMVGAGLVLAALAMAD